MERYLIAYEYKDTYDDYESREYVKVAENKKDVINFLSDIVSDEDYKLVSVVHFDFVYHTSKVFKPTLNSKLKLDLEEEK